MAIFVSEKINGVKTDLEKGNNFTLIHLFVVVYVLVLASQSTGVHLSHLFIGVHYDPCPGIKWMK